MKLDRLVLLTMTTAGLLTACADEAPAPGTETTMDDGTRIVAAGRGEALSTAHASATDALKAFLQQRGRASAQLQLERENVSADRTHVRLTQVIGGLRVYGAYAKGMLDRDGRLVHVIERLVNASGTPTAATITASDALHHVLLELGYDPTLVGAATLNGNLAHFAKSSELYREPTVERVAYMDGKQLREGFLVETWSRIGNQLDHTLVGGDGEIVSTERRTSNDSYNVFAEDPAKSTQEVAIGPGTWLSGAQTSINISGPNAHAYLDTDANNAPDAGGTAIEDGNFLAVADLTSSPTKPANQAVAVQNLFYLNNVTHDVLESHGFTNAAGNFEGNDPVNAEAQDGSGTDNANFSTPADGSSPRMQMYLWSGIAPNVDVVLTGGSTIGGFQSSFGPAFTEGGTFGSLASATPANACSAVSGVSGKIAIVDRGTCDFTVKVQNAQAAGAVAVLIVNNVDRTPFGPGGTSRKVRIPSAMVSMENGVILRSAVTTATARKSSVTPLMIDGDVDSDIVYHEYGHGLTWRMVGSMSGPISGALGEGASDTLAFLLNGDDRIGEYSASDAYGIRRYPYDEYALTYSAVTGAEVHDDGEIYAAAMWKVLGEYQSLGLNANDLLGDFVKGLDVTPAGPSFEAMRDGLATQARTYDDKDARYCAVHRGFARLGIGVGSRAVLRGRGVTVTQSFNVPAGCPAL